MRSRAARLANHPWRCYCASTPNSKELFNATTARHFHAHAIPSSIGAATDTIPNNAASPTSTASPDARFEVLGSNLSLLAVSLSASQNLFTRRGTLVGVGGSPEHITSTLSSLSPLFRAPLGVPFLYQKITSATPVDLLVSTESPHTSFAIINLDGTTDWKVTQRNGLLAWAGHRLIVEPTVSREFSLAHWGNSLLSGRGLVALAGCGPIFQMRLKAGEQYVVHPSNVLAYSLNINPPQPYRFKFSSLRLQIPTLREFLPDWQFLRVMREQQFYKTLAQAFFGLRTWFRKTVWGDRLFLRFYGPTTIVLQSRSSRLRDALSSRDVNEIADTPAGSLQSAVRLSEKMQNSSQADGWSEESSPAKTKMSYASVDQDGKVSFAPSQSAA